mgnify:CR=1 FL=1
MSTSPETDAIASTASLTLTTGPRPSAAPETRRMTSIRLSLSPVMRNSIRRPPLSSRNNNTGLFSGALAGYSIRGSVFAKHSNAP